MYLQFYQLRSNPFHSTPDPDFFFPSTLHSTMLESLRASIDKGESLVVLTGEAGLGKTLLLRTFLAQLDERKTCTLLINQTSHLSFNALLCQLLQVFGVKIESRDTATLLSQVRSELIKERILRRKVLLILDDAHNLPQGTLRQLPSLAFLEQPAEQLLQIVLAGHPSLEESSQLCLSALADASHFALSPLPLHESIAYVRYRLQHVTLSAEPIFTDDALETLATRAQGIPATLHQLTQRLLVAGCITQRKPLTNNDVMELLESTPVHSPAVRQHWLLSRQTLAFLGSGALALGLLVRFLGIGIIPANTQRQTVPTESVSPRPQAPATLAGLEEAPGLSESAETRIAEDQVGQPPLERISTAPILDMETQLPSVEPLAALEEPVAPVSAELPAVEAAAPAQTPENSSRQHPAPKKFPIQRVVKSGDTLWSLAMEMYGSTASTMMWQIQAANPQVRNIEHILVGAVLTFPDPKAPPTILPPPVVAKALRRPVHKARNVPDIKDDSPVKSRAPRKRGFWQFLRQAFQDHGQGAAAEKEATNIFRDERIDGPSD